MSERLARPRPIGLQDKSPVKHLSIEFVSGPDHLFYHLPVLRQNLLHPYSPLVLRSEVENDRAAVLQYLPSFASLRFEWKFEKKRAGLEFRLPDRNNDLTLLVLSKRRCGQQAQ